MKGGSHASEVCSTVYLSVSSFTKNLFCRTSCPICFCTFAQDSSRDKSSLETVNAGRLPPYSFFSQSAVPRSRLCACIYASNRALLSSSPFHWSRAASISDWVIPVGVTEGAACTVSAVSCHIACGGSAKESPTAASCCSSY